MGRKKLDLLICEKCGKKHKDFHWRKGFLQHLKNKDHLSSTDLFKCEECEKTFYNKGRLGAHRQRYHVEILLNCEYCQKEFTRKDNVKTNIRMNHETNFGVTCLKCRKAFKNTGEATFRRHLGII